MQVIERLLVFCVGIGAVLTLAAGLSLPVGCTYCIQSLLFHKPIGQDGQIKVFVGAHRADRAAVTEVLGHLSEARRRLEGLFADASDNSNLRTDIIIAPREALGNAADFAGAMQGSFFGPPIVMLPQDSVRTGVTSHELVHVYLANRLGSFRSETDMPHWFNEGLAMQVDHSGGFAVDVLCSLSETYGWPTPTQLRYPQAFYNSESHDVQVMRYAWSKSMVEQMMSSNDFVKQLDRFLEGEKWQKAFQDLLPSFERSQIC